MSEGEIPALKEALFAQQQLLQKLYSELDEEREASSTAASEALSMILRLQGEKAAVKMEANQYKRLAEEKICHAEEALAIFEDLIYQKEMEIASLEYQVQAYKYRLMSLGCSDIGVCETKFPENLLQRNEIWSGETSTQNQNQNSLRRNSTPIPFKFTLQKKGTIEIERSTSPDSLEKIVDEDLKPVDVERSTDSSAHGDINSYWEQIRRLDERVKEIADAKGIRAISLRSGRSSALVSPPSTELFSDALNEVSITKSSQVTYPEDLAEKEAIIGVCSTNVHDVFEVPQTSEASEKLVKPDCVLPPKYQKKALPVAADECQMGILNNSTICFAHSGSKFLRQFSRNREIVEADRDVARPEVANRGEEEIKLLKEIREQLNSIQSDIRSLKPPMTVEALDYSMVHLSEAMLHFWL